MPAGGRLLLLGAAVLAAVAAVALAAIATAAPDERAGERPPAPPEEDPRPNVVVLLTDDQALDSMWAMPRTRELIGRRGTTFRRAIVAFALCCPSRATLFTGQYAHNHGVLGNRPPTGGYARLDRREWLPVWLRRAGYRTMHVGKFLNRYGVLSGVPRGWDEWHGSVDPSTYQFYGYTLNENGSLVTYGADADGEEAPYQTDLYASRASELIAAAAPEPEPFFLSVGFLAPHSGGPREPDDPVGIKTPVPAPRHRDRFQTVPLPPSPAFDEADISDKPSFVRSRPRIGPARAAAIREAHQQRLESLLAVDEAVATIMRALRGAGELRDTLVIFTSDNGFFRGEHRIPAGKVLGYEPSIRVPLLIRGPGVPRGAHRRQLVSNADLAPTILDVAEAEPGRVQDGRSLLPLLRDPGLEWGRDLLVQGAEGFNQRGFDAVRTYRYVYFRYSNGERELYDLRRDPHQLRSRHADPAYDELGARLRRRLAALAHCRGRGCRRPPRVRLRLRRRSCEARAMGGDLAEVRFRSRVRVRDRTAPFVAPVRGRGLRARAITGLGRVVTLDRRLPRACRRPAPG